MRSLKKAAKLLAMGRYETELCTDEALQTNADVYKPDNVLILTTAHILYPYRPYDGKWSKTMVGFGPEDDHFVAELTYNYGVGEYQLGNDFLVGAGSFSRGIEVDNVHVIETGVKK